MSPTLSLTLLPASSCIVVSRRLTRGGGLKSTFGLENMNVGGICRGKLGRGLGGVGGTSGLGGTRGDSGTGVGVSVGVGLGGGGGTGF